MKIPRTLSALIAAAFCSQLQSANAQEATVPAAPELFQVVDVQGMTTTDPNALLYRRGTNPLTPVTRSDGHHITLDEYDNATGQVHIAARPGGGTDVNVDVQGLFPGELYTVWAAYFQEPGFPTGTRVGFGAVGEGNDMVADANGAISLDLFLPEGPMTVQGNAPSYAPISPILSDGVLKDHVGVGIAIAYHFNNPPAAPFTDPGPIQTWALQGVSHFGPVAIPEPSAIALGLLATSCFAVFRRRLRPEIG